MYIVCLDGKQIGTTRLECADPPMGVVAGKISFHPPMSPYQFFLDYCQAHAISTNSSERENELIDTQIIPNLRVFREDGIEIKGLGCSVSGFKDDGYEVTIIGIPYPFYGEEFPHHRKSYEEQFKHQTLRDDILRRYRSGIRSFCGEELDSESIDFQGANLSGADFSECFILADFRDANLERCRFVRANVKTCDFRGANLRGATFAEAAIDGAVFDRAGILAADFEGATEQGHTYTAGEKPNAATGN
jgi:uncharacterized protein YjbI with pentapeptide repeats